MSRLARSRTCRTGSGIIQFGMKMCTLLTPSFTGVHLTLGTSVFADTSYKADRWTIPALNPVQCCRKVNVLPYGPEPIILFVEKEQFRVPDFGHFSSRLHKGDNLFTKKLDSTRCSTKLVALVRRTFTAAFSLNVRNSSCTNRKRLHDM